MASAGRILMFPVGDWIQGNDYGVLDIVYYADDGSSYIAKNNISNSTTPPPDDLVNWQIHARGFKADALSEILAEDTSGVLGTPEAVVGSQDLMDAIADKVMTKLIPYANIANNFLATDPNTVLSGPMGKSLKELYDGLNSNLINKGVYTGNLNNIPVVLNVLSIYRAANTAINAPVAAYGIVETMYIDSADYAIQRFTSLENPSGFFTRRKNNGTWENWSTK